MARKQSAQNPYRWSNGSYHSRPERKPKAGLSAAKPPQQSTQVFKPGSSTLPGGGIQTGGAPKPGLVAKNPAPTLPLDPAYAQTVISNQRNLGIANADYAYNVGQLRQQFGLEDFSNPFSEAALLREKYLNNQRGTTNSYASAGQLYSGAYNRAKATNTHNYAIADDAMRRQYADLQHQLQRGMLQANADYGTNITAADWQRLISQFGGGR